MGAVSLGARVGREQGNDMHDKFTNSDIEYEIRHCNNGAKIIVAVFRDGKQVSPSYTADLEVAYDYFSKYNEGILKALKRIGQSDIENGILLVD